MLWLTRYTEVRYGVKAKPSIPVNVTLQRGPPPPGTPHMRVGGGAPSLSVTGTPTGSGPVPLPVSFFSSSALYKSSLLTLNFKAEPVTVA